jgi:hypothetical protein
MKDRIWNAAKPSESAVFQLTLTAGPAVSTLVIWIRPKLVPPAASVRGLLSIGQTLTEAAVDMFTIRHGSSKSDCVHAARPGCSLGAGVFDRKGDTECVENARKDAFVRVLDRFVESEEDFAGQKARKIWLTPDLIPAAATSDVSGIQGRREVDWRHPCSGCREWEGSCGNEKPTAVAFPPSAVPTGESKPRPSRRGTTPWCRRSGRR